MLKITIFKLVFLGLIFVGIGFLIYFTDISDSKAQGDHVVVYKSPYCGCCVNHIAYLRENGFDVEVKTMENMSTIKQRFNIPKDMESCHTSVIGDYFVEGHVPVEAINKLRDEKPSFNGIALPGMPSGSPGMPGEKLEPFTIYGLTDNSSSIFVNL